MKRLTTILLSLAAIIWPAVAICAPAAANEVKIHLKCDVTLEHAHKVISIFEQKGPEAVNVCLEQLEDFKAKGYIHSYTVKSYTCKKINDSTIQYSFDAEVCVNPSASKECKLLFETLILNKAHNKMMHRTIKHEFDLGNCNRSFETTTWLKTLKLHLHARGFVQPTQIDVSSPVFASLATGAKLGAYVHQKYGCKVKINEFKCELVK